MLIKNKVYVIAHNFIFSYKTSMYKSINLDNTPIAGIQQSHKETNSYWNKFKSFCKLACLTNPST